MDEYSLTDRYQQTTRAVRLGVLIAVLAIATSCGVERTTTDAADQVAQITCEEGGETTLRSETVIAQRDGVHYTVVNQTGEPASINGIGTTVHPGRSTKTHGTPPGIVEVACYPHSHHNKPEPPRKPLRVTDPHGFWIDPSLECESDAQQGTTYDYGSPDRGSRDNPLDLTRKGISGIRDDDVVERAAYPEFIPPIVRVVRDGRTIANVEFALAQLGGWRLENLNSCPSARIGT